MLIFRARPFISFYSSSQLAVINLALTPLHWDRRCVLERCEPGNFLMARQLPWTLRHGDSLRIRLRLKELLCELLPVSCSRWLVCFCFTRLPMRRQNALRDRNDLEQSLVR